jgi:hypothetical protein
MKKSALLAFLALSATAVAAPLTRDLGLGLLYQRVHQLPADLPTAESERKEPCVLDLRYVQGDAQAAALLDGWLRFHATAHTPVFVLANAATGAALLTPLAAHGPSPGLVVLGIASENFAPDIALTASPETEKRAYEALEAGTDLGTLLADNPDKPRNDEAHLAHEKDAETVAADPADKPAASSAPPPLIDVTLQRAVQLHRTLLALKKL